MSEAPLDLATARILVTNDDGIQAPGIRLLEKIALGFTRDVWVVAPETEQSGTSHSLTLRRPLRIRKVTRRRYAVDGTPTDAVLLAINHLLKGERPTLVLSGINRGGNLGEDVTYSGTIAAAMEATLLGVRAIALSQVTEGNGPAKWATAEHHAPDILRRLAGIRWPTNMLVNVNFPDVTAHAVTGVVVAAQGKRKIGDQLVAGVDPRDVPYFWIGAMRKEEATRPGTDLAAVNAGSISVTPLNLDLTQRPALKTLAQALA